MLQFSPKPGDIIVTKNRGIFICKEHPPWRNDFGFYGQRKNHSHRWMTWEFDGSGASKFGDGDEDYRVVEIIPAQQETPMQKTNPHVHAELIKAWADGAEIQLKSCGIWHDYSGGDGPMWYPDHEYRIKPGVKPDRVKYYKDTIWSVVDRYKPTKDSNLKLVFDANTGKLKTAEVIEIK